MGDRRRISEGLRASRGVRGYRGGTGAPRAAFSCAARRFNLASTHTPCTVHPSTHSPRTFVFAPTLNSRLAALSSVNASLSWRARAHATTLGFGGGPRFLMMPAAFMRAMTRIARFSSLGLGRVGIGQPASESGPVAAADAQPPALLFVAAVTAGGRGLDRARLERLLPAASLAIGSGYTRAWRNRLRADAYVSLG